MHKTQTKQSGFDSKICKVLETFSLKFDWQLTHLTSDASRLVHLFVYEFDFSFYLQLYPFRLVFATKQNLKPIIEAIQSY